MGAAKTKAKLPKGIATSSAVKSKINKLLKMKPKAAKTVKKVKKKAAKAKAKLPKGIATSSAVKSKINKLLKSAAPFDEFSEDTSLDDDLDLDQQGYGNPINMIKKKALALKKKAMGAIGKLK